KGLSMSKHKHRGKRAKRKEKARGSKSTRTKRTRTSKKTACPVVHGSVKEPAIMTGKAADEAAASVKKDAGDVKLLVFDMGHVFVDFDWDKVCQGFCEKAGVERDQFRPVLSHVGGLGYELGQCTTEEFLAELNAKLGTRLTVDEFTVLWNATFHENPDMA